MLVRKRKHNIIRNMCRCNYNDVFVFQQLSRVLWNLGS